jgi:hypothetical protein
MRLGSYLFWGFRARRFLGWDYWIELRTIIGVGHYNRCDIGYYQEIVWCSYFQLWWFHLWIVFGVFFCCLNWWHRGNWNQNFWREKIADRNFWMWSKVCYKAWWWRCLLGRWSGMIGFWLYS